MHQKSRLTRTIANTCARYELAFNDHTGYGHVAAQHSARSYASAGSGSVYDLRRGESTPNARCSHVL